MARLTLASIGFVLVLLSIGLVVMAYVTHSDLAPFREEGLAAEAKVESKSKGRDLRTPRYDVHLSFRDSKGAPVAATLSDIPMSNWVDLEVGETIPIRYLRNQPAEVRRFKDVEEDSLQTGIFAALFVLFLSSPFWMLAWWLTRRARRQS